MAPKRGGGSGGGGGDGSDSSFSDSPWGEKIVLSPGSHFHDPSQRAIIIILGICFFATCGIALAIPRNKRNAPFVYKWPWRMWPLGLSIIMSIIYVGNNLAAFILFDQEATVAVVYLLIAAILNGAGWASEISLLGFIYILIATCLQEPGAKVAFKNTLKFTSPVIITVLFALFAAIYALHIKFEVNQVINIDAIKPDDPLDLLKVIIAYNAVLVCASLEVLALAILIFLRARKGGNSILVGAFLIFLIATPQLIRTLFALGFDAASMTRFITFKASVANESIQSICNVLIYLGVLLVLMQFKKEQQIGMGYQEKPGLPQTNLGPWTNPAPGQQQEHNTHGALYSGPSPNPDAYASFGNGTIPQASGPYGNPHYGQPQYPPSGAYGKAPPHETSPLNSYYGGNPRSPANSSTASAYQAQTQYNNHAHQHQSPVSPVLRENGPVSPVLRESSPPSRYPAGELPGANDHHAASQNSSNPTNH